MDWAAFNRLRNQHTSDYKAKHQCKVCNQMFPIAKEFREHKRKCKPPVDRFAVPGLTEIPDGLSFARRARQVGGA